MLHSQTSYLLALYTTIIVILVLARLKYFPVQSRASKISRAFYDPVAIAHIAATYFCIFQAPEFSALTILISTLSYLAALLLFFKSMMVARDFSFAFSEGSNRLVTVGPYSIIRHPLYLSYSLIWITSTALFNSLILWITLVYLLAFYFLSAKSEENALLKSSLKDEYREYQQNVGMFLPRIRKWINWNSEP